MARRKKIDPGPRNPQTNEKGTHAKENFREHLELQKLRQSRMRSPMRPLVPLMFIPLLAMMLAAYLYYITSRVPKESRTRITMPEQEMGVVPRKDLGHVQLQLPTNPPMCLATCGKPVPGPDPLGPEAGGRRLLTSEDTTRKEADDYHTTTHHPPPPSRFKDHEAFKVHHHLNEYAAAFQPGEAARTMDALCLQVCDGTEGQDWAWSNRGHLFSAAVAGKCVSARRGVSVEGNGVFLGDCASSPQWRYRPGARHLELQEQHPETRCLTANELHSNAEFVNPFHVEACAGLAAQTWEIKKTLPGGSFATAPHGNPLRNPTTR